MIAMDKNLSSLVVIAALSLFAWGLVKYRKEDTLMLDLYVGLVMHGRRTCNPENKKVRLVPKIWRDLVIKDLEALGLDLDGKPVELTLE